MNHSIKYFLLVVTWLIGQSTMAQSFKIGTLDIYGNRKTNTATIYSYVHVKAGDSITHENFKPEEVAERLKQIPGVKYATVNPVCCDTSGNLMLYIGIGETDAVILKHRKAPLQNIELPGKMITAYHDLNDQLEPAIKSGQATEDDSQGYALLAYPPARDKQQKFIGFAQQYFPLLMNVLKNSKYAEQRAVAAEVIAYSVNRKKVVECLLYAVDDPDEEVRNNATRALSILARYAILHPELKISIPASPFIKMINSIVWTDRNKGAGVLMQLSVNHDPKLLNEIKQQALPSIIEMAKWKDRSHAVFAFVILGRIAGVEENLLGTKNNAADWAAEVELLVEKCK